MRGPFIQCIRRPRTLTICLTLVLASAAVHSADPPAAARATPDPSPAEEPGHGATQTLTDLPVLEPGLWEYQRELGAAGGTQPQNSTTRQCVDPTADMRRKKQALEAKQCRFQPMIRRGSAYYSEWLCNTPTGPMRFRGVLTVTDSRHYTDMVESASPDRAARQKITARRVGECPLPSSAGHPPST